MSARKKKKTVVKNAIPKFRTEDEERDFWANHDVVDSFEWKESIQGSFPALKRSAKGPSQGSRGNSGRTDKC
jgi:hypothetical protein